MNSSGALRKSDICHRVILFHLNQYFRPGMSDDEIYEGARGVWKINVARARRAEYAFGVYDGIVRGVYAMDEWHKAATTEYRFRSWEEINRPGRWEFVGKSARRDILDMYLHKSVRGFLPHPWQFPVFYVNV